MPLRECGAAVMAECKIKTELVTNTVAIGQRQGVLSKELLVPTFRVAVSQEPDLMGRTFCACILTALMSMKRTPDTWFAAGNRGLVVRESYEGTIFRTCIHSSVLISSIVLESTR